MGHEHVVEAMSKNVALIQDNVHVWEAMIHKHVRSYETGQWGVCVCVCVCVYMYMYMCTCSCIGCDMQMKFNIVLKFAFRQ